AMQFIPSTAVAAPPDVSTRSTPQETSPIHRLLQVAAKIDGSMKCHSERSGRFDQLAGSIHVNGAILIEEPKHHSVSAKALCHIDVPTHHVEFKIRVVEIS